jgi:hypothetical protein
MDLLVDGDECCGKSPRLGHGFPFAWDLLVRGNITADGQPTAGR